VCNFNPTTPSSNGTTAETLTVTTTAPSALGMNQRQLPLGQRPLYRGHGHELADVWAVVPRHQEEGRK
jgi:hypothetical protein